jgi:hypothetical protein
VVLLTCSFVLPNFIDLLLAFFVIVVSFVVDNSSPLWFPELSLELGCSLIASLAIRRARHAGGGGHLQTSFVHLMERGANVGIDAWCLYPY